MPDTGPPWNIPYVEPTDNPRVYPQASEDLADAIALGLSSAGPIEAVKFAIKTDVQSSSLAVAASAAVTGLTIDHSAATETNKIILIANVHGSWAASGTLAPVILSLTAGGTPFALGDADGSRSRRGSGTGGSSTDGAAVAAFGETVPGVTSSVTYGVDISSSSATSTTVTYYVNRGEADINSNRYWRAASTLMLIEVRA